MLDLLADVVWWYLVAVLTGSTAFSVWYWLQTCGALMSEWSYDEADLPEPQGAESLLGGSLRTVTGQQAYPLPDPRVVRMRSVVAQDGFTGFTGFELREVTFGDPIMFLGQWGIPTLFAYHNGMLALWPVPDREYEVFYTGYAGARSSFKKRSEQIKERAQVLLLDWLSEKQLRQYREKGKFTVRGSAGGLYVLTPEINFGCFEVNPAGVVIKNYCLHPSNTALVEGDVLLSQKLALEIDEKAAIAVANRRSMDSAFTPQNFADMVPGAERRARRSFRGAAALDNA